MELNTIKNLGGIGALLMFIGIPLSAWSFGIVSFIGLILLMIGAYGLSTHYREAGIFNNALYGAITIIVGVVVTVALAFNVFINVFTEVGLSWSNISNWRTAIPDITASQWRDAFFRNAGTIFITIAVLFVFVIIAAIFFRKSLSLTAAKTGVGLFGTTGIVLLIGAVLTIIFFGALLLWICLLLIAIAFFQIKTQTTQPT